MALSAKASAPREPQVLPTAYKNQAKISSNSNIISNQGQIQTVQVSVSQQQPELKAKAVIGNGLTSCTPDQYQSSVAKARASKASVNSSIANMAQNRLLTKETATSQSLWTQKQKSRRIVLTSPALQSSQQPPLTSVSAILKPTTTTETGNSKEAKLQQDSLALKTTSLDAPIVARGLSQDSEKQGLLSKSQQAAKRQRSALWIARANLLKMNASSMSRKANNPHPNLSYYQLKETNGGLIQNQNRGYFSPKMVAQVSQRAQQLLRQPHRQNQSTSPGEAFAISKSKKHSLQLARLTIAKLLRKRANDSMAIFTKNSSNGNGHQQQHHQGQVPSSKIAAPLTSSQMAMGELVFSSLAKISGKSRAGHHAEVAHLIKAGATQKSNTKRVKQKKKLMSLGTNTRQILASIGLNINSSHPQQVQSSQHSSALQPSKISQNAGKGHSLHSQSQQNQGSTLGTGGGPTARHQNPSKGIAVATVASKQIRRSSQSRLETFDLNYPMMALAVLPMTKQQRSQQMNPHSQSLQQQSSKIKNRLKKTTGNNSSLQSLKAQLFAGAQQLVGRETRPGTSQGLLKKSVLAVGQRQATKAKSSPAKKGSNSRQAVKHKPAYKHTTISRELPQQSRCEVRDHLAREDGQSAYYREHTNQDNQNFNTNAVNKKHNRSVESAKQNHYTKRDSFAPFNLNQKSVTAETSSIAPMNNSKATLSERRKVLSQRKLREVTLSGGLMPTAQSKSGQQNKPRNLSAQSYSDDSGESEQSVADEIMDPEAAVAVLRELGKLCLFQAAQGADGDQVGARDGQVRESDLISELSHRSHDLLGNTPSPLLSVSLNSSQRLAGDGHQIRRAMSEKDCDAMLASDAESEDDDENFADDQFEEEDANGEDSIHDEAIGHLDKNQQQLIASREFDSPSSPSSEINRMRHQSEQPRKHLTVPALQARQAFLHLGGVAHPDTRGVTEKSRKATAEQTATNKAHAAGYDEAEGFAYYGDKGHAIEDKGYMHDMLFSCDESDAVAAPVGLKNTRGQLLPPEHQNSDVTCLDKYGLDDDADGLLELEE